MTNGSSPTTGSGSGSGSGSSAGLNQKKFSELSDQLTAGLRPIRRLTSPLRSVVVLLCTLFFALAVLLLFAFGVRSDWPAPQDFASYVLSESGCLAAALLLAFAATSVRVPGASARRAFGAIGILLAVMTLGLVSFAISAHDTDVVQHVTLGWSCTERALILAVPSVLLAIWFVRRGAPVSPLRAAFSVAGLAAAMSAVVLPLVCEVGSGLHLLLAHLLVPFALVGLAVTLTSRWLFRW